MTELTFEQVRRLAVEVLGVDDSEITPDTSFQDDLNVEVMEFADFLAAVEEHFKIEIPVGKARKFVTVGDVVDFINDYRA